MSDEPDDDEPAATLADLSRRIENAARRIEETGTPVDPADVARTVADDLPPDFPPTATGIDRLDIISRIAADVLSGKWEAEPRAPSVDEAARVVEAWEGVGGGRHDMNAVADAIEVLRSAVEEA